MRLLTTIFAVMIIGLATAGAAQADDDFGARFSENAPLALTDPENALAGIEPAAGASGEEDMLGEPSESDMPALHSAAQEPADEAASSTVTSEQ